MDLGNHNGETHAQAEHGEQDRHGGRAGEAGEAGEDDSAISLDAASEETTESTTPTSAPAAVPVALPSTGRAADAGHLAAADIAAIAQDAGLDFRLIGGNAISLLVSVHGVTGLVPDRETNDADLGVPAQAVGAAGLVQAMTQAGYKKTEGNRFARAAERDDSSLTLEIDILIPSYSNRMENSQPFGELMVDAIPGLSVAIARPPTLVEVSATLTTGAQISYTVPLPDPAAALCMKAYAYRWRNEERDALDIWRLLEVVYAVCGSTSAWPKGATGRETAQILHTFFGTFTSAGPAQATADKAAQTRIRALVAQVVPKPE